MSVELYFFTLIMRNAFLCVLLGAIIVLASACQYFRKGNLTLEFNDGVVRNNTNQITGSNP